VTAAGAHTLDVWRYLVPAVPMVGIMLSLFAVELAETIALGVLVGHIAKSYRSK
jgi:hypothetical protein